MTPAARVAAAIEVLDRYLGGIPAEQALTGWARGARYAGSGDRAAVRDHVFDAIRRLRSDAALGGTGTGRGLMLGALRRFGGDPDAVFTGGKYAPAGLSDEERRAGHVPCGPGERFDFPDWLWPQFSVGLGAEAETAARALQSRAQVHLRVNLVMGDRPAAIAALARDGVICSAHPLAETVMLVTEGSRRIRQSTAYRNGLVELQDAASQAVVETLPLRDGMRVLDYCAGGGGKALAMAARARLSLYAHDIDPGRMRDLPDRAKRAGVKVTPLDTGELAGVAPFDLVLCDAPCSGSGAWRRSPQGKWALTGERLDELVNNQGGIMRLGAGLTARDGVLAYATCSLLAVENDNQIAAFLGENPGWRANWQQSWPVQAGADGFFAAHLTREVSRS